MKATASAPEAGALPRGTCQNQRLHALAERVARLNPNSPTIGAGMLASLVNDARQALGLQQEQAR